MNKNLTDGLGTVSGNGWSSQVLNATNSNPAIYFFLLFGVIMLGFKSHLGANRRLKVIVYTITLLSL